MCGFLSRVAGLLRSSSSYRACKPHPGNERPIWPRRECGTRGKWRNACIRGLTATTIVPAAVAKTRMLGASHWTRRRLDTRELPPRGWEVNSGGAGPSKPLRSPKKCCVRCLPARHIREHNSTSEEVKKGVHQETCHHPLGPSEPHSLSTSL
ncbi:hypothetical protein TcCL_ESM03175 [Trypanosoma cruzi]|nr:hypothetical protein TcCL_ESM03175 [Trypanosoma cruzi]